MTLFSDSFTRVDGDLGSTPVGGAPWIVRRGTVTIKNNRGFAENTSPGPYAVIETSGPDVEVSLTLGAGGGGGQAIYFREINTANWWRLTKRYHFSGSFQYELRLERCFAGFIGVVRSAPVNDLTSLRVVARGGQIDVYSSASATVPHWSVTDGTHATATRHGFGYAETTAIGNLTGIDDFRASTFNSPPDAPLLLSPPNRGVIDLNANNFFTWDFSDQDPGDSQSQFEMRWRRIGASTWAHGGLRQSPNPYFLLAAGTFAAGDYEWQVRTWDSGGLVGPFSSSGFFTAAVQPEGPTITEPVNGGTVGTSTVLLRWSAVAQDAYQVRRVADISGVASSTIIYYDSGEVLNSATRSVVLDQDVNSRHEHLQVRVKSGGLYSAWASVRVFVSYTPPAVPLVSVVPLPTAGSIGTFVDALGVSLQTQHPSAGQPTVTHLELEVQATTIGDKFRPLGVPVRIAKRLHSGLFIDYRVSSDVDYRYRAKAVASNGTTTLSPWVDGFVDFTGATTEDGTQQADELFFEDAYFDPSYFD